ncbi:MAG TPA: hypothetical protein VHB70_19630 [Parafilimonas sp.]|nr:hypothetical protein [Parafilimonas sp.]
MKNSIAILLLFIILVQTFSSFVDDAAYSLNKNYITENFCVNKIRPQLHCNGHCYLEKQIQKQEDSNKHPNDTRHERFEVTAYELPQENTLSFSYNVNNVYYNRNINTSLAGYSSSIFHPPLV